MQILQTTLEFKQDVFVIFAHNTLTHLIVQTEITFIFVFNFDLVKISAYRLASSTRSTLFQRHTQQSHTGAVHSIIPNICAHRNRRVDFVLSIRLFAATLSHSIVCSCAFRLFCYRSSLLVTIILNILMRNKIIRQMDVNCMHQKPDRAHCIAEY